MSNNLTIAELAGATGVSSAALRAWEERHDFPRPRRLEGGHRRYDPADVDAIRAVVAERASGATLRGAIERVLDPAVAARRLRVRRAPARPDWAPRRSRSRRWSRSATRSRTSSRSAPSRACWSARSRSGGSSREAEPRWRALARGARLTVVFADFPRPQGDGSERPARVPIAAGAPLEREWVVVHVAARTSAVLVGRQLPHGERRSAPRFEVVWSLDPRVAHGVVAHAARLAPVRGPGGRGPARSRRSRRHPP